MSETELYEQNVNKIYGFFMAKTWHKQTAEDLTSAVFLGVFEQIRSGRSIDDQQKYLYGVMKLTWLQYLRKKYTAIHVLAVEEIDDFSQYVDENMNDITERSIVDRALPYIEQLPSSQREVLLLRYRDGLPLAEICSVLQKNMNYVKTTQRRGFASLKRLVNEGGVA